MSRKTLETAPDLTSPTDKISVIQTKKLSELSPTFKNEVFLDLVSTSLDHTEWGSDKFTNRAKTTKAIIEALDPADSTQLLLAAQLASMHKLSQKLLSQAYNSQRLDHIQIFINLAVKTSNVFNQQISVMQKLKCGGQQKVVIEHVSVNNGSQAVIGTINTSTSDKNDK